MSTTVSQPIIARRRLASRRARLFGGLAGLLAATGLVFGLAELSGPEKSPSAGGAIPAAAKPFPGKLTAGERAAVAAALASGDARIRRLVGSVAAGEVSASALADPAIRHHHGVDTAVVQTPEPGAGAAERFHHR
jgi:hypothetical protein